MHGLALPVRAGQFARQSAVLELERAQVGDETVIVLCRGGEWRGEEEEEGKGEKIRDERNGRKRERERIKK